jgi:2,5-furandicarboxylate decarboxylase 1
MSSKDLRSFLDDLKKERPEDFIVVKKEIDPKFQLSALVMKLEKQKRWPVLLFERVKGTSFPVLTNLHAHRQRLGLALRSDSKQLVSSYLQKISNLIKPKEVTNGPVKEVIKKGKDINVLDFPQIIHHENDIGPYVTGAIAVAKDPISQKINASYNRLMIKGTDKYGIHLTEGKHLWNFYKNAEMLGKPLEVAFVIGNHPCWGLGALHISSGEEDEIEVMSSLLQEQIEMVPCETIDLKVPARAEIIIEGEILSKIREDEGPFGEFTGYSLGKRKREVVKVKTICHRKDAIYHDITVGHLDHLLLSTIPMEANIFRAVKASVPSLVSVRIPAPFMAFVSIEKKAEGQGINAILAAFGAEIYLKYVVVVDHDINIFDNQQVLWAISTRTQPSRDLLSIPNSRGSDLDPSSPIDGVTSKLGIDATASPSLNQFTPRHRMPKEILDFMNLDEYLK